MSEGNGDRERGRGGWGLTDYVRERTEKLCEAGEKTQTLKRDEDTGEGGYVSCWIIRNLRAVFKMGWV